MTAAAAPLGARTALVAPIACGCCLVAGAAYVAIDDPADGGAFPPCPFRIITGWWCPGCGLTRATHRLLRGDVVAALHYNAMVVVVVALIVAIWTAWLATASGRSVPWTRWFDRHPVAPAMSFLAVAIVFAIVRNLPGIDGLRG